MNGIPEIRAPFLLFVGLLAGGAFLDAAERRPESPERRAVRGKIAGMRRGKKPSRAAGKLNDGKLEHPAELAQEGTGYYLAYPERKRNFGHDRMVYGLMMLGVYLHEKLGAEDCHRARLHDISVKAGGKVSRHINHQMGLDVDIALYATDADGKPLAATWTKYDGNGKSRDGKRLFDAARNWTVVEGILENEEFGEVRAILLADWLKKKLLAHARAELEKVSRDAGEKARLKKLIERAEDKIRQPDASPHADHFHLSLTNQ